MLSRINSFQYGLLLLVLFALMTACGGGGGGTDSNGDGSIKKSDIEGLWTIYFTEDSEDTAYRMQVIYLMYVDDTMYCLVEEASEVKEYIADIIGSNISMNWNVNGNNLILNGVLSVNKMAGTWSEAISGSGTWEAIYGLDIEDPNVTLGDGQEVLIKIEEVDDFGTSTFYGTDPGDGNDPLVTKAVVQLGSDELEIDTDNDGQIANVISTDINVSISHNLEGTFDYEIRYEDVLIYTGIDLAVSNNSALLYVQPTKASKTSTRKKTFLDISSESEDNSKPTINDALLVLQQVITQGVINKVIGRELELYDPFFQKMLQNEAYLDFSITWIVVKYITTSRADKDIYCSNNDVVCSLRIDKVNDFLNSYADLMREVMIDITRQEWEKYQNDENDEVVTVIDDRFGGNMNGWTVDLIEATDWDYHFSIYSGLVVTNITPTIVNTNVGGEWAIVRLTKTFKELSDFQLEASLGWDSGGDYLALQAVEVILYDKNDNRTGIFAGYHDNWPDQAGIGTAMVDNEPPYNPWESQNKLPFTGNADIDIVRNDGVVEIFWDNTKVVEGNISTPISKVSLQFAYYAWDWTGGSTYFWKENVSSVKISGEYAP
jgi:hypothetical protein